LDEGALGMGSLFEEAHWGGLRMRSPLLRTLGYERNSLETGISFHGNSRVVVYWGL